MKKLAAVLVALALLGGAFALAFEGEGYPAWDGATEPQNAFSGVLGEERISLSFDPSTDYSNVAGGIVQACFFAYDATEEHYLELYLLFPQSAAAGDMFASGSAPDCSVGLYETSLGRETFYCAGAASDGSSFELTIEEAETTATALNVRGRLSARLCRYEQERPTRDLLTVADARFSFSLPLSAPAAPAATPTPDDGFPELPGDSDAPGSSFPTLPGETEDPGFAFPTLPGETAAPGFAFPAAPDDPHAGGAPAFTLPPDYAVL